jgi:hypothetical protein
MTKDEGMKRVQSLIKQWMDSLEQLSGWKNSPPIVTNSIRRAVVRVAWGAYKVGLLTEEDSADA